MTISLLCGGPSLERGISLNSARSVMDHLESEDITILPIYFDHQRQAYKISKAQLYSNTPADFDFKLSRSGTFLSPEFLKRTLKKSDLVFPVMHGTFGEDGEIQAYLEKIGVPYVGSSSTVCKNIFDKYKSNFFLQSLGFHTLSCTLLKIFHADNKKIIEKFFKNYDIKRAIVKPASGGSSIGVFSVETPKEALEKAELLFSKRMDTRVVIEPFARGREFTVIVLQNRYGLPVAIMPTEIETDYTKHQIFDFRRKYLPSRQVTYHCPPRFDNETVEKIQIQAEQIFSAAGMADFARLDGWILDDGKIWFSDLNPISGMEQNSFLFQQASRVGLSHEDVLRYIIKTACRRNRLSLLENTLNKEDLLQKRSPVAVIFGGQTSERQVSVMSGTNVWLKLRKSKKYKPEPYLLDINNNVWKLPYSYCLNHTVEEITANCRACNDREKRLALLSRRVRAKLGLKEKESSEFLFLPEKSSLEQFIKSNSFVFIGLHGGFGENGNFQKILENNGVKLNGSNAKVSCLCMDKYKTARAIDNFNIMGVSTIPSKLADSGQLLSFTNLETEQFWSGLKKDLSVNSVIVKPNDDGCSSGIIHIYTLADLERYLGFLKARSPFILKGSFKGQTDNVEMPLICPKQLLFEKFIETDTVRVLGNELKYIPKNGWIEVTVGVMGKGKDFTVFNPSITVTQSEVLTVEEKFQGGTGVNITPVPDMIIKRRTVTRAKDLIKKLANRMGIEGYCRIDTFINTKTGDLLIIEINTLPGLTPSTVLFQQALAQDPPIYPRELLEKFIENTGY